MIRGPFRCPLVRAVDDHIMRCRAISSMSFARWRSAVLLVTFSGRVSSNCPDLCLLSDADCVDICNPASASRLSITIYTWSYTLFAAFCFLIAWLTDVKCLSLIAGVKLCRRVDWVNFISSSSSSSAAAAAAGIIINVHAIKIRTQSAFKPKISASRLLLE